MRRSFTGVKFSTISPVIFKASDQVMMICQTGKIKSGGGTGIRTLGGLLTLAGFQERAVVFQLIDL
ncbi:hypothetical protein [Endozoicomonas sp. SCSIO W0465]|uniref:hypothetical protein n=1 Tax=Endozoicomonas sp. SCSIO W0465 TaxID=2918516 RepID=UPI002074FC9C|nr:hypothetical protein [Endozoicomonas sp. SCSIO W0465]USE33932.1 hypothetical protein MJO57_17330 [Endozoicomonas sp. SCSIO W0465]